MKNKKGVTIGRILLYILFISLFGFFIYIIACTFKAIKDKQPQITNGSTLKLQAPVTENISAVNFINSCDLVFYRQSDFVFNYTFNSYNYISNYAPLPYIDNGSLLYNNNYSFPYTANSNTYYFTDIVSNASVLNIGSSINQINDLAYTDNYYSLFNNGSLGLVYNCDIPIHLFSGSFSSDMSLNSAGLGLWVEFDNSVLQGFVVRNSANWSFSFSDFTGYQNYSKITRFFLAICNSSSNMGNYTFNTNNNFNSSYNVDYNLLLDFYDFNYNPSQPTDGSSATQFLIDSYINVYNSSDIITSFNNGIFTTPLNTINVDYSENPNFTADVYSSADYFVNSDLEYSFTLKTWDCQNYVIDNVFDLSSLFHDTIDFFSLSGSSLIPVSSIFNQYSTCLIINCNIPINNFSFIAGTDFSPNFVFYVVTDYDSTIYNLTCTSRTFNISDLGSNILGTSRFITQLIFPISQSFVQSGLENYPVSSSLRTGFNNLYSLNYKTYFKDYTGSIDFELSFDVYQNNEGYLNGYNAGYDAAIEISTQTYANEIASLNSTITGLESNITALNESIANQSHTITILQDRINSFNGMYPNEFTLKNFFFAFADIPLKTAHNVLDFQFFGVNLFRFFVGVITALGMLWLIKKIV